MSDIEQRIREKAYHLWLEEGCPDGRKTDHWDMSTELVAIEDGQKSTLKPIDKNLGPLGEPIEPLEAVRNTGEFPTLTDQGEAKHPATQSKKPARPR